MKLNEPTHKLSYGAPAASSRLEAAQRRRLTHQAPAAPFPIAELSPRIATTIDDLDRGLGSA